NAATVIFDNPIREKVAKGVTAWEKLKGCRRLSDFGRQEQRKRLTYPSFLPLRLVLGFPTMQDNHHREARDDQGRATDSMVQCYREPIKKRAEHCGLLS
ncbi:MAG: hypothetical protein PHU54_09985, partial [Candidatus Omnitrophica bacterium]|nr:hypothetical protein [Candidatus Omnitrophota bacterium]